MRISECLVVEQNVPKLSPLASLSFPDPVSHLDYLINTNLEPIEVLNYASKSRGPSNRKSLENCYIGGRVTARMTMYKVL